MSELIENLRKFNRKERFFLVGMALGNPDFALSDPFRGEINAVLGLDVPRGAFVGMDYHLDWIFASLYLQHHGGNPGPHANLDKLVRAHQEDIDLVVAYSTESVSHVVLLEAKGVTGWTNKQMTSKAARFKDIFGEHGQVWPEIAPHFALLSPRPPQRLDTTAWPAWMLRDGRAPWIELPIRQDLKRVTRCTADGIITASGRHWKVIGEKSIDHLAPSDGNSRRLSVEP